MSPTRTPPGDGVLRCRDAIDIVSSAPGHKYIRDRNELLQLLTLPHIQVSEHNFIQIEMASHNRRPNNIYLRNTNV